MRPSLYRRNFIASLVMVILACLSGCGSSGTSPGSVDVYAAGFDTSGGHEIAISWKNGSMLPMTNGTYGSYANSIAVFNGDVYVAGIQGNGSQDVAVYWENGQPTALTDGTNRGFANSIFVANGDVYVAGAEYNSSASVAKYWKNGVPVVLSDGTSNAMANSIVVSGTDVYVAGYQYETTQTGPNSYLTEPVATYWKNGTPVALTNGTAYAAAQSIDVAGQDVYVAGQECLSFAPDCGLASYWKNGTVTNLTTSVDSIANSISVSGMNVYVGGNQFTASLNYDVAEYWENGTVTQLSDGTTNMGTNQLVVSGSDVYIAGYSPYGAAYWKNKQLIQLPALSSSSSAFAIAVVPQ